MQTLKQDTKKIKPTDFLELPSIEAMSLEKDELEAYQVHWFNKRLEQLKDKIPALGSLVDKQGVTNVEEINEIAPLLYTHKVFKSYPLTLIEKNKFDKLTQWLDKLTTVDLSGIDTNGIKTIDGWIQRLNENGMWIVHSTGTTGKLSFNPKTTIEREILYKAMEQMYEACGENIKGLKAPVFFGGWRGGAQFAHGVMQLFGERIGNNMEDFYTLHDYPVSADFLSLAGRLGAAKASGQLKRMDMIKALVKSKGELIKVKKNTPKLMEDFTNNMLTNFKGERIFALGTTPQLLPAALAGLEKGVKHVFAPNSILATGGGLKGIKAPDNWKELMKEFYGVENLIMFYGMTEQNVGSPLCKNGHYHFYPYQIPIVLEPETGEALPREGIQTGRMGLFDLTTETMWGGILTGDKVTIHYDDCGCGYKGPHIEDNVVRYSQINGQHDDKISCAGSQEAYNEFLDFVAEE